MNFFYNSICHVCKEYKNDEMKRCGSCKFISYCCKDHQKIDWKSHKQICKLLANSEKFVKLDDNCGYKRWRSYRTYLQFYLDQRLERELSPYENQMWMFPRVCEVCYSRKNLRDCENCLCVAYCSVEHQTTHKKLHKSVCPDLKLCLEYDQFHWKTKETEIKLKNMVNKNIINDVEQLPSCIQACLEMIVDISKFSSHLEKIFITDIFAFMLTIIYGLEKCGILHNRYLKSGNLVVHIVGADIYELALEWDLNFQFLKKWIKNLVSCKFILIGPNCEWDESPHKNCDNIKIECVKEFYHSAKNLDNPDLIVSFNSGLHEFQSNNVQDTWRKSLEKLINDETPLVITSYTKEELEKDLKRLELFSMKIVMDILKNPFANLRPIRDWDAEQYTPFYINGYLGIVAGSHYHPIE